MIKVVICDDHPVCREGLKKSFSQTLDIKVAAEALTGAELKDILTKTPCDVVILDISLPGGSGLEILKELARERPGLPILMLSMHPEDQYAIRALRLGAAGYIPKDSPMTELIGALRKVATGHKYIRASQAELLACEFQHGNKPALERLSDRELQVMLELASGRGVKEIAQKLSVSPSTIGSHRTRIMEKLGLHSNADLVRYAVDNHLLK